MDFNVSFFGGNVVIVGRLEAKSSALFSRSWLMDG